MHLRRLLTLFVGIYTGTLCAQTVPAILGTMNRTDAEAHAASADDVRVLGATLIEDYDTFSVVRLPASAVENANDQARARGLRFEVHQEWDQVDLPHATIHGGSALTDGVGMFIVKFVGPERPAWGDAVANARLKYIQYFPYHAALVYGEAADVRLLASERFVAWIAPFPAAAKAQPSVCTEDALFTVQVVNIPESSSVIDRVGLFGIRRDVAYGPYRNVDAVLSCTMVAELLNEPTVVAIDPRGEWIDSGERESIGVTTVRTSAPANDEPWQYRWQDALNVWTMRPRRSTATPSPSYTTWLSTRGVLASTSYKVAIADMGLDGGSGNTVNTAIKCWDSTETCSGTGVRPITWLSYARDGATRDVNGHGTATASVAVAYGTMLDSTPDDLGQKFLLGMGVGPRLGLVIQRIWDTTTNNYTTTPMATVLLDAKTSGAAAESQSRNEIEGPLNLTAGVYSALDQEYDTAIKTANLPMTISTGNIYPSGWSTNPNYAAKTVMSPALAKNAITVGGSESVHPSINPSTDCAAGSGQPSQWFHALSSHDVAYLSRRGTASGDGRIKPEIVAPSTIVTLARKSFVGDYWCKTGQGTAADNQYRTANGTSFASPQAAAAIALINMKQGRAPTNPFSAAMMKAALVGGAFSIKGGKDRQTGNTINGIPDITTGQGFGRLYLGYLLDGAWRKTYLDEGSLPDFTAAGQQRSRTFTIADTTKRTVVVLAWSDFASAAGSASAALTRDLDLEVFLGNCASMWGNTINPATETTPTTCIVTTDTRNNVEMVVIPPNSGATFTVYVSSKDLSPTRLWNPPDNVNVTTTNQPFAIFALNAY